MGNIDGLTTLARCFMNGEGTAQNVAKAIKYYEVAANRENSTKAMLSLGNCYLRGEGVPQDKAKAIEWYQKAADLGNTDAAAELKALQDEAH